MITATIHPSPHSSEVALQTHRAVLTVARKDTADLLNNARKRSKTHSRKARESGHKAGLAEGLREGQEQFRGALQAIVHHYQAAADRATEDVMAVAHHIVEHLIGSHLQQHPEQLREWILQAVESLKHSRGLTLTYNPRYHDILSSYVHEFKEIMHVVSDPSLGSTDFELRTNAGGVSFSWREMLRTLSDPKPHRAR